MQTIEFLLDDESEVLFKPNHGRYLLMFGKLLKEIATRHSVRGPKDFDGYVEAEIAVDEKGLELSPEEWLDAYVEERENTNPIWFDPGQAIFDFSILQDEVKKECSASPDDEDLQRLKQALAVLIDSLNVASELRRRFTLVMT